MQSKFINKDYEIFEDATILSYKRNKNGLILTPHLNINGYLTVELEGIEYKLHRLVAEAFIPNIENKPYVNHKDGNKQNPSVANLEWVTASENTLHAYDNNLIPRNKGTRKDSKRINQYTKDGLCINTFDSLTQAAEAVTSNVKSGTSKIHQVCVGYTYKGYTRKTAFGYTWSYA